MNTKLINPQDHIPSSDDHRILSGWMKEIRDGLIQIQIYHERNNNTERRIAEYEERSADALSEIKHQVERVHARLDDMQSETSSKIAEAMLPVAEKIKDIDKENKSVRTDLDSWINRGKGAWFVASICAAIFQSCVIAVLLWSVSEVKTLHDWRISVEAVQREQDARRNK